MIRVIGAAVATVLFCAPLLWAAPQIETDERFYDFGSIIQGEKVEHVFSYRNAGDETLQIDRVKSSCGCTAALISAKKLAPGLNGELSTTFDSTRFSGPVQKTLYIYSNDPAQPVMQFHLRGTVLRELVFSPGSLNLGGVPPQGKGGEVTLRNEGDKEIVIDKVEALSPQLTVTPERLVLAPGERATLSVQADLTSKRLSSYILLHADQTRLGEFRIPVYAVRAAN